MRLSWPTADFLLQYSLDLTPASWQAVTNSIQYDRPRSSMTLPDTNQRQFFRLKAGNDAGKPSL